jgi:hypothetical protein
MQTFRNYLSTTSNRSHFLEMGKAARVLASITDDPRGIILDIVEEQMPYLYGPLLEAFYLETDDSHPALPADAGVAPASDDTHPPRPPDAVAGGDNKAGASDSGSVMDWLRNLFGGGGAEKSFGRAITALTKVDSVLQTINVPPEAQAEGGMAVGYDDYKKNVNELFKKLKELGGQSKLLNVADSIKKDPNYVQEISKKLTDAGVVGGEGEGEEEAGGGEEAGGEESPPPTPTPTLIPIKTVTP